MMKKLMVMVLSAAILLTALSSALAVTDSGYTYFTVSEYEELTGKKIEFNEAPEFRTLVAAGELPPVEERLPEEPLVLLPRMPEGEGKIGKYGGVLRTNQFCGYSSAGWSQLVTAENSFSVGVYPDLIQSYESANGSREWTLHLRKGLKWSDGVPFTTGDIMFWYEDIALNKEYSPGLVKQLRQESGLPKKFIRIDDYTLKIVSDEPYFFGDPVDALSFMPGAYPKHYLKQFHPKYQDKDTLDKMVEEGGFDSWIQLLGQKVDWWQGFKNVDKPRVTPWVTVQSLPEKTVIFKRNPYYYAVDAEGNQLPYIDEIYVNQMASAEVAKLKMMVGEQDWFALYGAWDIYSLAKEAEQEGKIKVILWPHSAVNTADLEFNLTIEDPVLRKIFRDKRFRFAASYALDREMMNQLIYLGVLEPKQVGFSAASPFYNERLNKTAIEYDTVEANRLLDEMGLDERDADGWRLRPDGKRLEINLIAWATDVQQVERIAEIITDNLKDVGLFTNLRIVDRSFALNEMRGANTVEAIVVEGTYGTIEGLYIDSNAFGIPNKCFYAPLWEQWYNSDGEKGEKPILEILQAVEAHTKATLVADFEEKKENWKKITDIAADNLWVIGTLTPTGWIILANPKLQNIPTDPVAWFRGDHASLLRLFFYE